MLVNKKAELRKLMLEKQISLIKREREYRSGRTSGSFFEDFNLFKLSKLHVFYSIEEKAEFSTHLIINKLWNEYPHITTILPRVNFAEGVLEHLEYNSETHLKKNEWDIFEPASDVLVNEQDIDIVLVPLLCFDTLGFRVGHGKGFYDKFLIKCRKDCLKIGLSLFDPIERIEDIEPHDVKLDYCITPKKVWEF